VSPGDYDTYTGMYGGSIQSSSRSRVLGAENPTLQYLALAAAGELYTAAVSTERGPPDLTLTAIPTYLQFEGFSVSRRGLAIYL